jgi:hypothetical protein
LGSDHLNPAAVRRLADENVGTGAVAYRRWLAVDWWTVAARAPRSVPSVSFWG